MARTVEHFTNTVGSARVVASVCLVLQRGAFAESLLPWKRNTVTTAYSTQYSNMLYRFVA
jgi:hypothetical protein